MGALVTSNFAKKLFGARWLTFRKNGYVSEKNFQWEKIFKIDIFVLKYVLNHSKSIPTKKFFRKFFDFLGHFWSFLGQKIEFFDFLGQNF